MAARSPRKGKSRYKVKNWSEYNKSLVRRGRIDFWIDKEVIEQWHPKASTKKKGGQQLYSDLAIQACLSLRLLFHIPLRQTQGFMMSLIALAGLKINSPNYTTISRRTSSLKAFREKLKQFETDEAISVLIDSSGVKIKGSGQWHESKHGKKGSKWLKLHLAVDEENSEIEASILSSSDTSDSSQLLPLLEQIEKDIQDVKADGAYDYDSILEKLESFGIKGKGIFPPAKNRLLSEDWLRNPTPRDKHILRIAMDGKDVWEYASGYSKRNRVENTFFRFKNYFGDQLKSRKDENQEVEIKMAVHLLNQMTRIGMPKSERIR